MDMLVVASNYLSAGLCVLPANPSRKTPRLDSWKQFHTRRPSLAELERCSPFDGICLVCGPTSGNLEMIDFDGQGVLYNAWHDAVMQVDPSLLSRLVIEQSPSGGFHVIYRCPDGVEGNQKLAQRGYEGLADATPIPLFGKEFRPRKQQDGTYAVVLTLIETRGTGGMFLCAPTPGYQLLQGRFEQIPDLTAAERTTLLQVARSLNEWHPDVPQMPMPTPADHGPGEKPGKVYNARGDVPALLVHHGWTLVGTDGENQRWRRPGKLKGVSATWHTGKRVFYNFSSSVDLPADKGISAFALYTYLEHGGHFPNAARELRRMGFGQAQDPCAGTDIGNIMATAPGAEAEAKAEASEPPVERVADPGRLPVELLTVPGLIGEVMKQNLDNAINPIPELALAAALCLQAVLVGRKVQDPMRNRTNLYVIGTAPSGAGKNTARTLNRDLLYLAGATALEGPEDIASDSGLLTVIEDNPSVLFQIDEIGRFLKTLSTKDSPHLAGIMTMLMRLFSSAHTVYKGKAYADRSRTKVIDCPNLVIYGTGVAEEFYDSMTYTALVNGSMARLMVFEGIGEEELKTVEPQKLPEELIRTVRGIHEWKPNADDLANVFGHTLMVKPTDDVSHAMADFRQRCHKLSRTADAIHSAIWARCAEKAHKLALIYACSKSLHRYIKSAAPLRIDMDAAEWACRLAEWNTRRMIFLADRWVSSSPFEGLQKRLLRYLDERGGKATRRDIMRRFHLTSRDCDQLLSSLIETGDVKQQGTTFRLP